jgi:DMSO/TMAO reductase YedYZ molybdopterin-dependent catalytic subunit
VRNHFPTATVNASQWKIRIEGVIDRPGTLNIEDLRGYTQHSLTAVLECAGNGVGSGGISCASWRGPLLGELIRQCGILPEARYVRLTGADRGREPDSGLVDIPFSRTISLHTALSSEAILALEMNGAELLPDHGFPVRVLIAGQYGMNSVKWLERIELLAALPSDLFMTRRFRRVVNSQVLSPVASMLVKSIIVQPKPSEIIRGAEIDAGGYAWGGEIVKVEVSLDNRPWQAARMLSAGSRYGWTPWKVTLANVKPGAHTLVVRACNQLGDCQPEYRDPARQDEYELNHNHRVRCMVRPG